MSEFKPILTEHIKDKNCHSLSFYQNKGGYTAVKHVLQIEEPTDHTQGDDGGKLKYKIIWGDKNQKE